MANTTTPAQRHEAAVDRIVSSGAVLIDSEPYAAPKPKKAASTAGRVAAILADLGFARKYDPSQPRNPDGTWGDGVGAAVKRLLGDLVRVHPGGRVGTRNGSSIDWGSRLPSGDYEIEATGDDGRTVMFDMSPAEVEELHRRLTEALGGGDDPGHYPLGPDDDDDDPRHFDWSTRSEDDEGEPLWGLDITGYDASDPSKSEGTVMELTEGEMREWHTALTVSLIHAQLDGQPAEADDSGRAAPFGLRKLSGSALGDFNEKHPRRPDGTFGTGVADVVADLVAEAAAAVGDTSEGDRHRSWLARLATAATGGDALDSAPVHLKDAPGRHGGNYDGAAFSAAPAGHGDPLAVAEMEGLEYERTNSYLWDRGTGRDRTKDGSGKPYTQEQLDYWAERDAVTQRRIDEVDKSMAVSPLPQDAVVHRGVKSGSDTFGWDIWLGMTPRVPGEPIDFALEDAEYERFESGWRPDLTGLEWTQHSYLHTTVREDLMSQYARNLEGGPTLMPVAMRIILPAGTPALRMSDMDKEAELMAARGLKLRVVKDHGEDAGGVRHLDIEVVGTDAA